MVTNAVVLPLRVPTVGAVPAPPPITGRFAVSAAEEERTDELEKYGMPPEVPARLKFKEPEPVTGEPVTVKIPDGEVELTVRPTDDTVPAVAHVAVVPLEVRTCPLVPMPRRVEEFVPLPMIKSPVEVIGVARAIVPEATMGDPVTVYPAGAVNATEVTVPPPPGPEQAEPKSTKFPEASIETQCPFVVEPVVVTNLVVFPE